MQANAGSRKSNQWLHATIPQNDEPPAVRTKTLGTSPIPLDWAAVWKVYGRIYQDRLSELIAASSPNLEHELLFCILGGHGVSFELARSAAAKLRELDVFAREWEQQVLEDRVREELERPQFSPLRNDGSFRRYRFPSRKAFLVAGAASWVNRHRPLAEWLRAIGSEEGRREFMCQCPGVGLKSASWLLRNAGLAQNLAVIDIHVLRALTAAGRINGVRLPHDYLAVENQFLEWCAELAAPPAAMDLLLWEWQRAL
jgi:thermostable 8-oxoguanine DNA glycosylase